MSDRFRSVNRQMPYLMRPSLEEWLPEDHLAHFVVETVEHLDTTALEEAYDGRGSEAYHPKMLLALLFYGYATGTFSSRKIEEATYDSVAFRYVAANQHPDHDTICTFRRRFLEELEGLFVQILEVAVEMGLLEVGDVALDGTKVKARRTRPSTSKHKALSYEYACKLEEQLTEEVEELMEKAEEADAEELPDETSVPEEIARREERLKKIREAKQTIEERARERHEKDKAAYEEKMEKRREEEKRTGRKKPGPKPEPPEDTGPEPDDQVNLTDEASRIMFTSENGFQQAYNAQATVCMDSHLLLEGHLSQRANDKQELEPALQNLSDLPEKVGTPDRLAADSGYYSSGNVEACEGHRITPYISTGREEHNQTWEERFSEPEGPSEEESGLEKETGLEAMAYRLETREGKDFYGRRKGTAEPIFGIVKEVMGIRQFLLRGLEKVKGEWALIRCAFNLRRMHRLLGQAA